MQLFTNNAASKLVSAISNVALSLQVTAGEGAKFPSPTGGDFFLVTLSKVTGGVENTIEIVKCTGRTGDSLTIVRGQEGTTPNAYAIDDRIELRMTAGTAAATESHINNTSNPHAVTKTQVGLGNVDNTSDVNKPVSTAQQAALDLKAPLASPTFTGTVGGITKAMVGLGSVDNTADVDKPVSNATQTALNLKANLASPTFTGTVSGVTKAMVGLANVDNTSDASKPVSTATQTALDLKANLASPTFTGTVSGITKAMVGLGNVDNTTDAAKPVSTATQTALNLKANLAGPSFTGNVVLGSTSSDTVTVNGYMGVGGAGSANVGAYAKSTALTGTGQVGFQSQITGSSAATAGIHGFFSYPATAAAAYTNALMTGFYAANPVKGAGSTITNLHGLYVADQTQGTNNYGITSLVSSGANKWNIYASGTAQNYFAGNVGIGVVPSGAYKMEVGGNLNVAGALTINGAPLGGGTVADGQLMEFSQLTSNDYTLSAGKNAIAVKKLSVASGKKVTIPSGQSIVVIGAGGTSGQADKYVNTFSNQTIEGQKTFSNQPNVVNAQSMIRVQNGNGYGSTNNKIGRFQNITQNQGNDITYADSATLGGSFTINTNGVYAITFSANFTAAAGAGISKNTVNAATSIAGIPHAERLAGMNGSWASVTWVGFLSVGDVIRAHTDGTAFAGSLIQDFTISRVS